MEKSLLFENEKEENQKKNNILEKAQKIQNDFYSTHQKKTIFKKTQKIECAKTISQTMNINELLDSTLYIIPNKNIIYFDYNIFKLFANFENYDQIINYFFLLKSQCVYKYFYYEFHINLHLFSISALERYKKFLEIFAERQQEDNSNVLLKICIYNSPSFIDTILKVLNTLINQEILNKAVFFKKEESAVLLNRLLGETI
jgi:hypothetical protein